MCTGERDVTCIISSTGSDYLRAPAFSAPPISRAGPHWSSWGIFMWTLKTVWQESPSSALVSPASQMGKMCCCFSGFCSEFCRMIRFTCCTHFKRIETKETVAFTAHVPGLKEEDLEIEVESGFLVIIGNRSNNKTSLNGSFTTTKTSSGQFVKLYKLPMNALAEDVRVEVDDDGFITITFPKSTKGKGSTN